MAKLVDGSGVSELNDVQITDSSSFDNEQEEGTTGPFCPRHSFWKTSREPLLQYRLIRITRRHPIDLIYIVYKLFFFMKIYQFYFVSVA